MSNRLLLFISLGFLFQACSNIQSSDQSTSNETGSDSLSQNLNLIGTDTILEPEIRQSDTFQIHIFQKGETLWELCKKYYGNRHYSSILSIYNGIQNVNQIEPDAKIKTPPLNIILTDKNFWLVPILKKEVYKILAARQLYVEVEKILWDTRKASNWNGQQNLSKSVVNNLESAADLIDLTISQLNQPKGNGESIPKNMINNLRSVSRNLKHLASGANDGYGYDLDMIHQDLIRAILNGRAWALKNSGK